MLEQFEIGLEHTVSVRLEYCSSCPLYKTVDYTRRALDLANSWLESCGYSPNIRIEDAPLDASGYGQRVVISAERPPVNRRDFLFSFVRSSGSPTQALAHLPEGELETADDNNAPPHQPAWLRQLAAIYPRLEGEASMLIRGEEGAAKPTVEDDHAERPSRRAEWPTLQVNDDCTACGACARYCPSGALSTRIGEGAFEHRFIPGVCIACGLCAQVCHSGALTRDYAPEAVPFTERVMAERPIGVCRKCGSPATDALAGLCYWCANEPSMRGLMEDAHSMFFKLPTN